MPVCVREIGYCHFFSLPNTHQHESTVDVPKTGFSHSVLTPRPALHRLQSSDLIGPTNWPSVHLMLTRNGPITVFKADHNVVLRPGLEPKDQSISSSPSPGQCISLPSKRCIACSEAPSRAIHELCFFMKMILT